MSMKQSGSLLAIWTCPGVIAKILFVLLFPEQPRAVRGLYHEHVLAPMNLLGASEELSEQNGR